MSGSDLHRMAQRYGVVRRYDTPDGETRTVPDSTLEVILDRLGATESGEPRSRERLTVPPGGRCFLPEWLEEARAWGVFCQLYELNSDRNWGIGDFADLAELARICGAAGADFLGVNPLHALFLAEPDRRSPFSPSNRRFFNPLYIAPDLLPGCPDDDEARAALRENSLIDYPAVAQAKLAALRDIFEADPFGAGDRDTFDSFVEEGGEALRLHAVFEVISARMMQAGHGAGWPGWPEEMRDPRSAPVRDLAEREADEVRFHLWLQWICDLQLRAAERAAREAGMRIGLYLDLAVGEAPDGSSTWSGAAAALEGVTVGAPPDLFAAEGQNWGLSAPSPAALDAAGFAPFREMLDAQLRHAGALRIDHVMGLWQLFLVPEGVSAREGAYLRSPFAAMLRVLAELSHKDRAIVIGEDLGTVPEGFREVMEAARVLSYRVLYFEQDETGFVPPARYPRMAMACLSTHDLPPMAAWWHGIDIELRRMHGILDEERSDADAQHRHSERKALLRALEEAGLPDPEQDPAEDTLALEALVAAYRFVARTPTLLAAVRLADLVGPEMPTNLPGTLDEHPNWRPRAPVPIGEIAAHPAFAAVTEAMRAERPREQT